MQTKAEQPNIVLCMSDDQGWGDMGYYGHPKLQTPHFDDMAATGLRFDRFYAAAPLCSPTRGSVMTGRHPNRFGCFKWGYTLRPQEVTVAELLRRAGYATGHFGKWHLGSVCEGGTATPGASGFDEWFSAPNFFDNDPILSREGRAVQTRGEGSMVTVDAALGFIRKHAAAERPFLAVVWFGSPHSPHEALPEDRALYADQPPELQHFYGEITAMDRAFGKLRNELRTLGIHENTLLWYCSDNGGLKECGVTGGRAYKGSVYEGGLRVPGILEWPAQLARPTVTETLCSTCDILPTVLDAANVRRSDDRPIDGVSLVPLIRGGMQERPEPMGFWNSLDGGIPVPSHKLMTAMLDAQEAGREPEGDEQLRLSAGRIDRQYPDDAFPGHAAWLDWPWKLHRIETAEGEVRYELYDLARDPGEETDLVERESERVAAMRPRLHDWLVSVVHSLNGEDYA